MNAEVGTQQFISMNKCIKFYGDIAFGLGNGVCLVFLGLSISFEIKKRATSNTENEGQKKNFCNSYVGNIFLLIKIAPNIPNEKFELGISAIHMAPIFVAVPIFSFPGKLQCKCLEYSVNYIPEFYCAENLCDSLTTMFAMLLFIDIMFFSLLQILKAKYSGFVNLFSYSGKPKVVVIPAENKIKYNLPPKIANYDKNLNMVGIDFGTTECCAAVIRANGPDCVVLDGLNRTMPSYVAYDEDKPKCGQLVISRMRNYEAYTVFDVKRLLGKQHEDIAIDPAWPFQIKKYGNSVAIQLKTTKGNLEKTPEDVSGDILKHIKFKLEEYQNKKLSNVVIAISSKYSERQKTALVIAAQLAGWEQIHFIPEPIAAAYAYFNEMDIPNNSKILVFDFGGGTVDVCIIEIKNETLEVLSFEGDYYLGGRNFDSLLYTYFDGILKHKYDIDVSKINKAFVLLQKCHEIIRELSTVEEYWLDVSDFDCNFDEQINISRHDFEMMATSFKTKIINVILDAISSAKLQRDEINYVIQVGGSSRMPLIKNLLSEMFSSEKLKCCKDPDWVVAQGATLYGYHTEQRQTVVNE